MPNRFFTNENQLKDWIEAAWGIKERFGNEKALGYLIGEKYYNLLKHRYDTHKFIRSIEKQKRRPGYDPIRKSAVSGIGDMNLDEVYSKCKKKISVLDDVLLAFAGLIKESFDQREIASFLRSNPRFGALGHICSEDEHRFLIEKEAVDHSIETEVEDALIFGELERYLASRSS